VISERPYELVWPDGGAAWIQDFELEHRERARVDIARIETPVPRSLCRHGGGRSRERRLQSPAARRKPRRARDHRSTRLLQISLQTGVPFSQATIERTLASNTGITQNLVRLFETLFDPEGSRQAAARAEKSSPPFALPSMVSVSLDEGPHPALVPEPSFRPRSARTSIRPVADGKRSPTSHSSSIPRDSGPAAAEAEVRDLRVQPSRRGRAPAHGYVARGGLRWSDRREDFRTEVLA